MRGIIGTVVAVAALGIAASTMPAAARVGGGGGFHGGFGGGGFHGGFGGGGFGGFGGFHGGAGPTFGMGRVGPAIGGPRAFAPGANFAARTFPNTAFRPGFRGFRGRRFFPGFAFGFGGPFWYDYGPDYAYYDDDYGPYAYDYGYGYGNNCYALRRVFVAGRWRLRSVWVCG
jgi:hypothetical protein